MKNIIVKLLVLSLVQNINQLAIAHWEKLESQDGYFSRLLDHNFVLVAFLDSDICPECVLDIVEKMKFLEENRFAQENEIELLYADVSVVKKLKSHYSLKDDNYLYFFVRN